MPQPWPGCYIAWGLPLGVGCFLGSNPSYHAQHRDIQPLAKPAMPRLICLDMGVQKICVFQVRKTNSRSTIHLFEILQIVV